MTLDKLKDRLAQFEELAKRGADPVKHGEAKAEFIKAAIEALGSKDVDLGDARGYMRLLRDNLPDDADTGKAFVAAASKRLDAIRLREAEEKRAGMNALEVAAFLDGEPEDEDEPERLAIHVADVPQALPQAILSIERPDAGAILSDGAILTLAGEGGVGKSALGAQIAHGVAVGQSIGGILSPCVKGPVVIATFEDAPGIAASQVLHHHELAKGKEATPSNLPVHIIDMNDAPLFGPVDRENGDRGFYNQRPDRLPGWNMLWDVVNDIQPAVVILDAATDAYVGDTNSVPQVAAFLAAVRTSARLTAWPCGVIMLAHSTKEARRRQGNAKPDPFKPGNVAGSAAWTDKARGVLAFMWGEAAGERTLAVPKANYGLARVVMDNPEPIRKGMRIMGFQRPENGGWTSREGNQTEQPAKGGSKRKDDDTGPF